MAQQNQNSFPIDPFITSGTELATVLNELNDAYVSLQSGTSRPTYAVQGYKWLDVTDTTNIEKMYTGSVDLSLLEYDTIANKAIVNGGNSFTDTARSIKNKTSNVSLTVPTAGNMEDGEFFLNNADKKMFFLDGGGTVASADFDTYGIQRGSNSNGSWIKFPDGTQICQHTLLVEATSTAVGGIYVGGSSTVWTFPISFFNDETVVSGSLATSANTGWLALRSESSSDCNVRGVSYLTDAVQRFAKVIATGRWK